MHPTNPEADFGVLVERLYASAFEPQAVPDFVSGLASAFDSHLVCIQRDLPGSSYLPISHFSGDGRRTDAVMQAFTRSGIEKNDLMDPRHARRLIREGTEHDENMLPATQIERLDFYNAVMHPLDIRHSLGFCLQHDACGHIDVLNVNRSRTRGHYTSDDMALARRLLPHLRNVHALQRRLRTHRQRSAVMELMDVAAWLLDARGHVVHENEIAERYLADHSFPLAVRQRKIRAISKADDPGLQKAVTAATSPVGQRHYTSMVLHGRDGKPASLAVLHPLHAASLHWAGGSPAYALLTVRHIVAATPASLDTLRQAFGLTVAEARLATAMLEHGSLASCQDVLGKSRETLRSQLKALFAKAGCRSQAELVLKLRTFPPADPTPR